jgi:hypothetical protein
MSRATELSVVLPCFNEAGNVARVVQEAAELARLVDALEIVVVDDGSTDETASIVESLARRVPGLRLVRHEKNRGYGASLRSGSIRARSRPTSRHYGATVCSAVSARPAATPSRGRSPASPGRASSGSRSACTRAI